MSTREDRGVRNVMAVGIVLFGMGHLAAAQPPDARARLGAARTLQCALTLHSTGRWTSGEPQAEVKPIRMSLRFEDVDTDDGTARFVGSSGRSDVAVRFVMDSLNFIQSGNDGAVSLTTVVARPAPEGRWLAVHTRHEFTETSSAGVTMGPAQYYGTCAIER